jgi:hypothetical protein
MNQELCINCYQGITNPICGDCYTKQLAQWFNEIEDDSKLKSSIIKKIIAELPHDSSNDMFCIICAEKIVSLCTYCFFFNVEKILRESSLPPEKIEQFLTTFNYNLYQTRKHFI